MPSTIRINATDELLQVLAYLKGNKYSLMDNAEIIRAVLSEYYLQQKNKVEADFEERRRQWEASLPELKMTPAESKKFWKEVHAAKKSGGKIMTREELWKEVQSD